MYKCLEGRVDLTGAYYTAKVAIPYIKKQGGGKIIIIGSGLGHKGRADNSAYSCSKAGLWMLTRLLVQSVFSVDGEWIKKPEDVTSLTLFMATQPLVESTGQSFSLIRRDL